MSLRIEEFGWPEYGNQLGVLDTIDLQWGSIGKGLFLRSSVAIGWYFANFGRLESPLGLSVRKCGMFGLDTRWYC